MVLAILAFICGAASFGLRRRTRTYLGRVGDRRSPDLYAGGHPGAPLRRMRPDGTGAGRGRLAYLVGLGAASGTRLYAARQ